MVIMEIEQTHLVQSGFAKWYVDSSRLFWDIEPGACHRAYGGPDLLVHPQTTLWIA